MTVKQVIAALLCTPLAFSQTATQVTPDISTGNAIVRPYFPATLAPIRTADSTRIQDLTKAGKLYLTVQDAIALALENNIDLEVNRYAKSTLEWRVTRAEAGGALAGVPSNASQASGSTAGQGVLGSQQSAGVGGGNNAGGGRNTGNATITQVGPVVQVFDPSIQQATTFSHRSVPLANATNAAINVLIQGQRVYSASIQQGLVTGGSVTVSYNNRYLNENAPTDVLNPSLGTSLSVSLQHNLLQGFGRKLNERNIDVAKMNLGMSDLSFRTQVNQVVVNVLNNYWALSGAYEDLKSKETVLTTAEQFFNENKQRVELGALAEADLPSSQSQIATAKLNVATSLATLLQREVALKALISRNWISAGIVPLDRVTMPEKEDLDTLKELVTKAYANRSDLLTTRQNLKTNDISGLGTKNGLLPSVQAFATVTNSGLAGTPRFVKGQGGPDPYFVGGLLDSLGQIFRRNFPTESVGVFGSAKIHNRQAQADYGIDQLSTRQQELSLQKDLNQAQVDISNSVIALKQARVRYDAAKENTALSQQLVEAEDMKFKLGESTSYNVVVQHRDLATAKAGEISALVSYQNARVSLNSTLGITLEANSITLGEARAAKIVRASVIAVP